MAIRLCAESPTDRDGYEADEVAVRPPGERSAE